VGLMVKDDEGQWSVEPDTCTVWVIKVDLDIVGVYEEDEDDPGGYIAVNTDDDNKNSTQDRDSVETTVDNEDDLVEISLSISPSMDHGYLKLQVGPFGLLRFWEAPTKGTNPMTQATWDLSEGPFPQSLWVEAYLVNTEYPISGLQLSYLHPTMGYTVDSDGVVFNPVEVRLSMDGVTEDKEEFPGNFIGLNDDDDDDNGMLDYMDDENDDSSAEDDMLKIFLHDVNPSNNLSGTMTFDESSAGSKVTVWKPDYEDPYNKKKFERITLPETFDTPHEGGQIPWFYVEGISHSTSPRDVEFSLSYTLGGKTFKDVINLTVVRVNLKATDLDGNVVSNQYEEDPGVDLHFNIDNDNDSDNSVPNTKFAGSDYYETTNPVTNENDVKSLEMSLLPSLDFGQVVLSNLSSAWLWKSPTKGSSNFVMAGSESKTWDLSVEEERNDFLGLCSTLYAEGMNISSGDIVLIYEYPVVGNDIHSDKVCYHFIAATCGDQPTTEEEDIYISINPPDNVWPSDWQQINGYKQRNGLEGTVGPNLRRCQYSITDNLATRPWSGGKRCTIPEYNCIAWSVDESGSYYSKTYIAHNYGNPINDIFEDDDMDDFYYQKKGWTKITSGEDEERAQQAEAMYYSGYHAARKRSCSCGAGKWIMYDSKCGQGEKIEHVWNQLNGSFFGNPVRFYK